ncbi:cartilage matrix protein [Biomphalaria pfeifferi]|uniref:Cartilage matrix protein n=1 Tax=Biomphalaria pfeifferi TaxID=112525 RepID=A0AAD8BT77_BIOPF|nr:cartilage matrix protein [Biomphalaria pfeifferi]
MRRIVFKLLLLTIVSVSQVRSQNATKAWAKKKADIFFLADCSGSIWIVDYRTQLKFIVNLVSEMDIGPDATRVGVGLYSETMTVYIPLNNTMTKAQLMQAIEAAPFYGGNGYVSRGIDGMRRVGLSTALRRTDVPLISVLFTDDAARHLQFAMDNATLAKKEGITMFTVSVGRNVGRNELRLYSSDPYENYIFEIDNFNSFDTIRSSLSSSLSQVEHVLNDKGTCGENTHMDVLFLYDEYAHGKLASGKIKRFLQNFSEDLSINTGNVRVGVVSKTCHEGEITFIQHLKRESFIQKLNEDNGPDISTLLKHIRRYFFVDTEYGARDFAKRRLVAFLHGDISNNREIINEFLRAKFQLIEVFIVNLNTDYNKATLERIASGSDHVLYLSSADDLLKHKKDFLGMFCKDV